MDAHEEGRLMTTSDENWDRKTRTTWSQHRARQKPSAPAESDRVDDYDKLLTRTIEREREALMREALWRTYCWCGGALLTGITIGLVAPPVYRAVERETRRFKGSGR